MVLLTSINGEDFYLNCDLIYKLKVSFDTIITLIDGKCIRVKDSPEDIVEKIIQYKKSIYSICGEGNII